MNPTYDFTGKVVLVTGSSRGMGAAILEACAAAGATCLLNYFEDEAGQNRRDAEQVADFDLIAGIAAHDLYHAGQIAILKRAQ